MCQCGGLRGGAGVPFCRKMNASASEERGGDGVRGRSAHLPREKHLPRRKRSAPSFPICDYVKQLKAAGLGGWPRNLGDGPWLRWPLAPLWPSFSLSLLLSAAGLFTWPRVTDSQPHV